MYATTGFRGRNPQQAAAFCMSDGRRLRDRMVCGFEGPSSTAALREHLDLDPPVPLENNVYLGMKQTSCEIPEALIEEKRKLHDALFVKPNTIKQGIVPTVVTEDDETNKTAGTANKMPAARLRLRSKSAAC